MKHTKPCMTRQSTLHGCSCQRKKIVKKKRVILGRGELILHKYDTNASLRCTHVGELVFTDQHCKLFAKDLEGKKIRLVAEEI